MSTLNINSNLSWADMEEDFSPISSRPSTPKVENISSTGTGTLETGSIPDNNLEINKFGNLLCYTFTECDENSPLVQQLYRGIIKNENGEVICQSFGYTPEFSHTDDENLIKFVEPVLKSSKCYVSYEGSIIRLFYNKTSDNTNTCWQLSTHRKIDSFNSRWGSSKSYGELFVNALVERDATLLEGNTKDDNGNFVYEKVIEEYTIKNKLDKNYNYIFMITTSNENRIVCENENNQVFFVGAFNSNNVVKRTHTFSELGYLPIFEYISPDKITNTGFETPTLVDIKDMNELKEYVSNVDYKKSQGLIFITNEGRTVKVLNDKYYYYSKLRGNNPNILLRYLELQYEKDKQRVKEFVELYDDKRELFIEFGKVLDDICGNIYRKYRNRFVRKMVSIAPPEQYYVIRELHDHFLRDKVNNIVTPQRVAMYVFEMSPERIYGLYHMYTKRRNETGNGNKLQEEFKTKVKDFIYQ